MANAHLCKTVLCNNSDCERRDPLVCLHKTDCFLATIYRAIPRCYSVLVSVLTQPVLICLANLPSLAPLMRYDSKRMR